MARSGLFGWYIVELEGGGAGRGELYGRRLFERLAAKLKAHQIKGTSRTNLRKCREFYQGWAPGPELSAEMQQTASDESLEALIASGPGRRATWFLLWGGPG